MSAPSRRELAARFILNCKLRRRDCSQQQRWRSYTSSKRPRTAIFFPGKFEIYCWLMRWLIIFRPRRSESWYDHTMAARVSTYREAYSKRNRRNTRRTLDKDDLGRTK